MTTGIGPPKLVANGQVRAGTGRFSAPLETALRCSQILGHGRHARPRSPGATLQSDGRVARRDGHAAACRSLAAREQSQCRADQLYGGHRVVLGWAAADRRRAWLGRIYRPRCQIYDSRGLGELRSPRRQRPNQGRRQRTASPRAVAYVQRIPAAPHERESGAGSSIGRPRSGAATGSSRNGSGSSRTFTIESWPNISFTRARKGCGLPSRRAASASGTSTSVIKAASGRPS